MGLGLAALSILEETPKKEERGLLDGGDGDDGNGIWCLRGRRAAAEAAARTNSVFLFGKLAVLSRER